MSAQWKKSVIFWTGLMVIAACCIVFIESYHQQHLKGLKQTHVEAVQDQLSDVTADVEYKMNSAVFLANTLPSYIALKDEHSDADIELLANNILRQSEYIEKIALTKGTVITHIFPAEGNEAVIGIDLINKVNEAEYVRLAMRYRRPVISESVELAQGGQAVIGYLPIEVNGAFWGIASVVYNNEKLFVNAGLRQLETTHLVAAKFRLDRGDEGKFIYGDDSVFSNTIAISEVQLPLGTWEVAIASKTDWLAALSVYQHYQVRLLGYAILMLAAGLLILAYYYHTAIENLSLKDELTGLPNRRYMMEMLDNAMSRGATFTLLNLDLNKFKQINDTYGHAAGDLVLVEFARCVTGVLRQSDTVCRQGGDEFLVMLPRVSNHRDIVRVMAKLRAALDNLVVYYNGTELKVSATIGYAVSNADTTDINQLMHQADNNMYQGKRQQGTVIPFHPIAVKTSGVN